MKKTETTLPIRKRPLARGKYANLLKRGTNIAILDPDIVEHFPDSESVNDALRAFLAFGREFATVTSAKRRAPKRAAEEAGYEFDPRVGIHLGKESAAK